MRRGDVVLLNHPFSDGMGAKVRPVLIVSNDADNARLANVIVAMISKNLSRAAEPTHFLIDIGTAEGRLAGLNTTSVVVCNNLFTVHQRLIVATIGSLPRTVMVRIDECLRAALALP